MIYPRLWIRPSKADDHIVFQAGSHDKAILMKMADYRKLVKPKVLEFSYHLGS